MNMMETAAQAQDMTATCTVPEWVHILPLGQIEGLAEAEIDLSVGTVGDAYDNALAECVIGLLKTEVINQIGPWKSMREVEWETLKWVDWYNNHRLLSPIGYIPPAEAEEAFYTNLNKLDMVA